MTIDEFIAALQELSNKHGGDVEVTVWQYGGGLDDLCDVSPVFDADLQRVLLETTCNPAGIRQ